MEFSEKYKQFYMSASIYLEFIALISNVYFLLSKIYKMFN